MFKENYLLSNNLETSNQWYAIAKIAGLKLCEAFKQEYNFDTISLMPTNLYGPKDNYDLQKGHVMAALIRKFYEAKIKNKNKSLLESIDEVENVIKNINFDNSVLVLQGAGDIKDIMNIFNLK